MTKPIERICIHCSLLGNCQAATLEMLRRDEGCGSWKLAAVEIISARLRARNVAGSRALKAMLLKDPPNKTVSTHRR